MEIDNNNANIYSVLVMLYINDVTCNMIKDLGPMVRNKDKESQKIYNALKKRVKAYDKEVQEYSGKSIYFLAEFSSFLDEYIYPPIEEYKVKAENIFKKYKTDDPKYLAMVSATEFISFWALCTIDLMSKKYHRLRLRGCMFEPFKKEEFYKISKNLSIWSYRHIKKGIDLNENNDVSNLIKSISKVVDSELFNEAYEYSKKEIEEHGEYIE